MKKRCAIVRLLRTQAQQRTHQMLRAQVELEKGNTQAARRLLDSVPAGYDPDGAATSTTN